MREKNDKMDEKLPTKQRNRKHVERWEIGLEKSHKWSATFISTTSMQLLLICLPPLPSCLHRTVLTKSICLVQYSHQCQNVNSISDLMQPVVTMTCHPKLELIVNNSDMLQPTKQYPGQSSSTTNWGKTCNSCSQHHPGCAEQWNQEDLQVPQQTAMTAEASGLDASCHK